jgi:hypothetical protein
VKQSRYSIGDAIVLREIWEGKIWTAKPMIVVQDDAEVIALHIPINTVWKNSYSLHGEKVTTDDRMNGSWILKDTFWPSSVCCIRLTIPGESYSVLIFRNTSGNEIHYWYINLEDPEAPMHRTRIGFECTDLILDMIIESNLKDWYWKDEDELQEAVDVGLISDDKARLLYTKGEQVRDLIMTGNSIFNSWENWRPDHSMKAPSLPEGWDVL